MGSPAAVISARSGGGWSVTRHIGGDSRLQVLIGWAVIGEGLGLPWSNPGAWILSAGSQGTESELLPARSCV